LVLPWTDVEATLSRGRAAAAWLLVAAVTAGLWALSAPAAMGQQKIGYIDSEYILNELPEYATVQQKLDRLEEQWRGEIETAREEVDRLQEEFQARELLYTEEERTRKREAIQQARQRVQELRRRYFGPDGELYSRQKELMRPIQERVLAAVEEVATAEGYDYVFDRSGEYLFMFAREQYNLSDAVLRELGINVDRQDDQQAQRTAPDGQDRPADRGNRGDRDRRGQTMPDQPFPNEDPQNQGGQNQGGQNQGGGGMPEWR
jgi:outer membrane protein